MRLRGVASIAVLVASAAFVLAVWGAEPAAPGDRSQDALAAYAKLPLTFVENRGQADARVRFEVHGSRFGFHFARDRIALSFLAEPASAEGASSAGVALALKFVGADPDTEPQGVDPAPGATNYLRGDDPGQWQTDVSGYRSLVYPELWPGIDMVVRGEDGRLKYEFHVQPGARPSDIRLAYAGADSIALAEDGELAIDTPMGELRDSAPVSYQEVDGRPMPVESSYDVAGGASEYGFTIGDHRADRELVIDPGIAYSTFLGGSSHEDGNRVAVDASGNAYVVGTTQSTDFPTTTGAFDRSFAGGVVDVFVSKLNASGSALVYSTYLGGTPATLPSGQTADPIEFGRAIAVDGSGNAHITGQTSSSDFPTTSGALDPSLNIGTRTAVDGFVTKLDATGSGLVYSTFLGGTDSDDARGIALDASGNAYVSGETASGDFPATAGAFDTTAGGGNDAFAAKLNATGSTLAYATYLGGADNELANRVKVDADGNAYVVGSTRSADFPTTPGAFDTTRNGSDFAELFDAFVTRLNADGSGLGYSTFLGGSTRDFGDGLAIDAAGNAYVSGGTTSADFPTTDGAFDATRGGGSDGYAAKLDPSGSSVAYSTLIGGSGGEGAPAIALAGGGGVWLTGGTDSADFPTSADGFDRGHNGSTDAYVVNIDATGGALVYGTFLGGANGENGADLALDGAGDVYVTGRSFSPDFPTTAGAFDTAFGGDPVLFWGDAFLAKLSADATGEPAPAALSSLALDPTSVTGGGSSTGTVTLTAAAPTGGAAVALASDNPVASVPGSVTVPAGETMATFSVSTTDVPTDSWATISASYQDAARTATLTITARVQRTTTNFSGRIDKNQSIGHTVSVGATGQVDVALDWIDSRADLSLRVRDPGDIIVFSNTTTARPKTGTFTASTTGDYRFEITNTTDRRTNYTLAVTHPVASSPAPPPATLSSLSLDPMSVSGGVSSTGTVTLTSAAPSDGASVALDSSNTGAATVPAAVTVPGGQTSAQFTVSTSSVGATTSSTFSAAYEGITRTATLEITASASSTDTVTISRAEYAADKRQLRVEASSSGTGATLRVHVTATDELIGTLSGGKGEFSWPTNPQSITVNSSLGGSATRTVTAD